MAKLKKIKEDIKAAIGLVASEYSYAKDLQAKLEILDREETDKALRDTKKGLKILRWVGRGERKVDRSEQRIMEELNELGKILPKTLAEEEQRLLDALKISEAKLVKAASIFTGELREELLEIETDEQLLEKLQGRDGSKIQADLQNCSRKARASLDELLQWVSSTESILKEIAGFEEKLERMAAA